MLAKELHYIGEIISNENEDITETKTKDTNEAASTPTIEPVDEEANEGENEDEYEIETPDISLYSDGYQAAIDFADKDIYTNDSAIGENLSTEIETNDISLLVRSLPLAEQAKFTTSLLDGEYKTFCK